MEPTRIDNFVPERDKLIVPSGFVEREDWGHDTVRTVWVDNGMMQILTYSEGDVILMKYHTKESFDEALTKAEEFYKEF